MQAIARVPWPARVLLALLVLTLTFASGCATHRHGAAYSDGPTQGLLTAGGGSSLQHVHLEPTRHRDWVRGAIIAGVVFIIVGAFLVDLFLLPFSYRRRHLFFPCCRTCVSWCH